MSIALYKIADEFRDVLSWDVDNEPDAEALAGLLDEIAARFEDKAAAVVAFTRNVEAEAKAFEAEEKRLKEVRQRLERRAENLKKYLEIEMRRAGLTDIDAGLAKLKFVKNPWSVEIEPTADLPNEFLRFKAPEPDKAAIKAALEAGQEIAGCRLVQSERLRIA